MKSLILGIAAGGLLMGSVSFAQTSQGGSPVAGSPTGSPSVTSNTAVGSGSAGAHNATMVPDRTAAAASGNNNQAVATTNANAPTPAKGSNSFTAAEAQRRLEKNGFSNVSDLAKDDNGVWRGNAQKSGSPTTVWLDYKGNTGEGK